MATKLLTPLGGGVTLEAANTATDKTLTLPADNGTVVYANSSGNVGIGTSSPAQKLDVKGSENAVQARFGNITGRGLTIGTAVVSGTNEAGAVFDAPVTGGTLVFQTQSTERARIDSSGNLLVGTASPPNLAKFSVQGENTTNGTAAFSNPDKGVNVSHIHYGTYGEWYIRPANSSGKVYVLNYQAESDERLKKDIISITYGLAEILTLQPRQFRWKNGNDEEVNGFIAQEVEAAVPALVSEGQWKAVDYQGITAILVKAIQEQQALITSLTARIEALEGTQ